MEKVAAMAVVAKAVARVEEKAAAAKVAVKVVEMVEVMVAVEMAVAREAEVTVVEREVVAMEVVTEGEMEVETAVAMVAAAMEEEEMAVVAAAERAAAMVAARVVVERVHWTRRLASPRGRTTVMLSHSRRSLAQLAAFAPRAGTRLGMQMLHVQQMPMALPTSTHTPAGLEAFVHATAVATARLMPHRRVHLWRC